MYQQVVRLPPYPPPHPTPISRYVTQNVRDWAEKGVVLLEKARLQREEGEHLLDDARERLPKVSQSVKALRMYLDYLKLARRQIELEREFGLGALRSNKPKGGGGTGAGKNGELIGGDYSIEVGFRMKVFSK